MSRQTPRHIPTIVGQNLRVARTAAGLNQRELAQQFGIESFQVSRWERGNHRPSDETLIALAEFLGREFAWFFTDHGGDMEKVA